VPHPRNFGSAWDGLAPNMRPEMTALPTDGTKLLNVLLAS
jgi:hypothetical protein